VSQNAKNKNHLRLYADFAENIKKVSKFEILFAFNENINICFFNFPEKEMYSQSGTKLFLSWKASYSKLKY
jgi:hypothetical protein